MKVAIAHPHQQHSYKLAAAVKKAGHELIYITTVYNKPRTLTRLVEHLLTGSEKAKARSRKCEAIDDSEIHQFCELSGLIVLLLFRIDKSKRIYNYFYNLTRKRFGKKAARYAISCDADVFIGYDICCYESMSLLRKKRPEIYRVIDYSAVPQPSQAKYAFEDLATFNNENSQLFIDGLLAPIIENYAYSVKELSLLQHAIVASQFTSRCLQECGIPRSNITVAPYGFPRVAMPHAYRSKQVITFVFCGRCTLSKGVHHLLKAFEQMNHEKCHLLLVGSYNEADPLFEGTDHFCTFTGPLPHEEALRSLSEADVFVFPSLTDGMSLACMEAMALGLPVIATSSTGASQFIQDGINGFVVDPSSTTMLVEQMSRFVDHPELIESMGVKAYETAKAFGWDLYETEVRQLLLSIQSYETRGCFVG